MKFKIISFCVLVLQFIPCHLAASEVQTKIVTAINTNRLICSIIEKYNITVHQYRHEAEYLSIDSNTPLTENISIVQERNLERLGRRYLLRKSGDWIGSIQIGLFSDQKDSAAKIFKYHIRHTSMGPNKDITAKLGDKAVGWWEESNKGFGRILFIRDNVVVNVSLSLRKLIPMGISGETTMEIAKAIDTALGEGTMGVRRGKVLKVPRILAVETPKEIFARSKIEAKVHVAIPENPQDKDSKEIEIRRTLPLYVPFVSPDEKSEDKKTFTYEVTYITPGCVVTSQKIKFIAQPAKPSG